VNRLWRCAAACSLSVGVSVHAASTESGADYPAKAVRIIVGFAPGGGVDIVARILAQKLVENTKQPFVVDNRAGAGGSIGAALVAKSVADGYTLLAISSSYAVVPSLYKDLAFDPLNDLAPVSLIGEAPLLLVVHPSLPAHSVQELSSLAKPRPGQLNYGSGGNGTSGHLAGELFKYLAGVNINHVPYKGAGASMIDVVSGQVSLAFASVLSTSAQVKAGRLRALAVTIANRSSLFPQLPTIAESGVREYRRTTWYGMLAPARTPADVLDKLNAEIGKAVSSPDVRRRLSEDGGEPGAGTARQFHDYLISEIALSKKIIERANVER
jgi:tripartite-type tricarboxylate transporter receptor subunit TctC